MWPSTSGGSLIEPMVWITPSTAATMPSAGVPSARAWIGGHHALLLLMVGLELLVHQRFHLCTLLVPSVTMRR